MSDHQLPMAVRIDWERSRVDRSGDVLVCAINLDRSPDRWALISTQLEGGSLPFLRLSAIDGRALDSDQIAQTLDKAGFEAANGRNATAGDIGCYLSHVAAWTVLSGRTERYLLVVEDDAAFEPDWERTLNEAIAVYQPGMLMKLSWQRLGLVRRVKRIGAGHDLMAPLTHQACNAAYLIDAEAAEALISKALPLFVPVDHYVELPWLTGVPVRSVRPALASQRGMGSTIDKQRKFHWYRRVPTLFYRLKVHSLRLLHGLGVLR